jgi:hypothetical protein
MATYNAPDLLSKPRHMGEFGNITGVQGSVTPAGGLLADVYTPVLIPAGLEVWDVSIVNDDLDSGGTSMAASVGYTPVNAADGPTANATYFSAASTFLTAAGRKECAFQPIKFEKPVFLTITLTVAATTFVAGKVTALVKGDGLGIK